jgi:hypothetical protein
MQRQKAPPKKRHKQVKPVLSNLHEGLSRHALEHLILPVLSIDEYESKISDKRAVVIGFFVQDEAPAKDLSHFIERSSLPILDTEVSPNPTEDGFYITWVELRRSKDLPTVLSDLLSDIENLCKIDEWQFTCPHHTQPNDLNKDNLTSFLILDPQDIVEVPHKTQELKENKEFWKHATVNNFALLDNILILETSQGQFQWVLGDCPETAALIPDSHNARELQKILGSNYAVFATDSGFIVECGSQQRYIQPLS